MFPHTMTNVGTSWLTRGGELAALLGEQAELDRARREASLDLGPTKMDPGGRGCGRNPRVHLREGRAGPVPVLLHRGPDGAARSAKARPQGSALPDPEGEGSGPQEVADAQAD